MTQIFQRIGVPVCVAVGHLLAFYAACSFAPSKSAPQTLITIELSATPETHNEVLPPENSIDKDEKTVGTPEESEFGDDAVDGGNVEDTRAFELPELTLENFELPEYTLQEISDAAAGTDGDTFGDGLEFGEIVAADAKNISPQKSTETVPVEKSVPVNSENPGTQVAEQSISGAEKKGKQGNRESTQKGSFGSGGNGGKSALATAQFRHRVAPKYPRSDELAGRTGTVVLLLEIGADGKLKSVSVKKSSGSRSLDSAAIRAARASSYVPAREGDSAIDSRAEAAYTFRRER